MKDSIKTTGLLIILCMMVIYLPCCRGKGDATVHRDEGGSGTETISAAETGDRPSYMIGNMSSDTLILTAGTSPVYWPEFCFWLKYIQKYYRSYHGIDSITDWGAEQNGMSLRDFFLSTAAGYACKDRAIETKAKELDIELSAADLLEIEKQRADNIKIYGSESEYIHIVSSMYVSEDVFKYLTKIDYLGNYLFERLYGAKGERCTDEEVSIYVKEEGLMCAKYIFLSNADSTGNDAPTDQLEENSRLMKVILERLDRSDDPLILFDELMKAHGKDRDILNYPDGRLFVSGAMGQEFEKACLGLKEDRYSGIVQTDTGIYIILRKPVSPDMTADSSGNSLRYHVAYDHLFKNQIEEWTSKMDIRYEDVYHAIDVEDLQGN